MRPEISTTKSFKDSNGSDVVVGDAVKVTAKRTKTELQNTTEHVVGNVVSFETDRVGCVLALTVHVDGQGDKQFRHENITFIDKQ